MFFCVTELKGWILASTSQNDAHYDTWVTIWYRYHQNSDCNILLYQLFCTALLRLSYNHFVKKLTLKLKYIMFLPSVAFHLALIVLEWRGHVCVTLSWGCMNCSLLFYFSFSVEKLVASRIPCISDVPHGLNQTVLWVLRGPGNRMFPTTSLKGQSSCIPYNHSNCKILYCSVWNKSWFHFDEMNKHTNVTIWWLCRGFPWVWSEEETLSK